MTKIIILYNHVPTTVVRLLVSKQRDLSNPFKTVSKTVSKTFQDRFKDLRFNVFHYRFSFRRRYQDNRR